MATKKSGNDKRKTRQETARKIWLAGIGAYGRAVSDAQDAFKEISQDTSKLFDELVEKGQSIEATVQEKGKEFVEKTKASTDDLTGTLDDRIKEMRSRLNRGSGSVDDAPDLEDRLAAIEAKLDKVLKALAAKPAAKKTTTRKPAAKKPAAKKPTTKKPTPRKKPAAK